ncbi:MAG: hypothetical protein ACI87E_001897 [Mariniblastus sp.]
MELPSILAGQSFYMVEPPYDSFQSLFPMPMTSIEKFHWFDDSPEYPNVVFCRLKIRGKIDQATAKQAWQYAVQRQPFGDVYPAKIKGRWFWNAGPRSQGETHREFDLWDGTRFEYEERDSSPPAWKFSDHPIRSAAGSYLGITVWPEPTSSASSSEIAPEAIHGPAGFCSEVWLYVHHSVGDGVGSILVINDWMVVYANLMNGRAPEKGLHRLDPELLKQRNSLGILSWRYLKHVYKQPIALFGAAKFIMRKTAELLPGSERAAPPAPQSENLPPAAEPVYPAIIGRWISESQVEGLAAHAKRHQVMLNSVLLGQLYLALAKWRAEHTQHTDRDWMRIILPMSIRNVSDRRLPTANRATIVQVDRCGNEMRDLADFYRSLNREIMVIRGWQLDKIFLLVIRGISLSNKWLLNAANDTKSRGMAVFTNLGEPLRKSERASSREPESMSFLRPFEFDLVGPIRTGTPINFSTSRYGPKLRISMQYDHRLLNPVHAQALLDDYVMGLEVAAGETAKSTQDPIHSVSNVSQ